MSKPSRKPVNRRHPLAKYAAKLKGFPVKAGGKLPGKLKFEKLLVEPGDAMSKSVKFVFPKLEPGTFLRGAEPVDLPDQSPGRRAQTFRDVATGRAALVSAGCELLCVLTRVPGLTARPGPTGPPISRQLAFALADAVLSGLQTDRVRRQASDEPAGRSPQPGRSGRPPTHSGSSSGKRSPGRSQPGRSKAGSAGRSRGA